MGLARFGAQGSSRSTIYFVMFCRELEGGRPRVVISTTLPCPLPGIVYILYFMVFL